MSTQKIRCLIVDDEPIARQILRNYVAQIPNLECAGECKNAFEAIEKVNADEFIQILFLDINMPNLNGMAMVKIISRKMQVIFTTAYSDHAVESYELNAADYLLKPFLFERFAQAVFKAVERLKWTATDASETVKTQENATILVKSNSEVFRVNVQEILFCEAMKNYTKIIMRDGHTFYPLISISKLEEDLAQLSDQFLRVHRSFLVSKKHLGAIGARYLMVERHKIPIGILYKPEVFAALGVS